MNNGGTTSVLNYGMKTGVAKITLGAGATSTVELWVGPTGSPVYVGGAPLATVTTANLEGVDGIRIMGRDCGDVNSAFDNLLIGTTMADVDATDTPPPITATWTNTAGGQWGTAGNWLDNTGGHRQRQHGQFQQVNITADTTVIWIRCGIGNLVFGDTDIRRPLAGR